MATGATQRQTIKKLREIYKNPESSGGLGGVERLYKAAKKEGLRNVNRKTVLKTLQTERTYQIHKPYRRNFRRSRILTFHINDLWEADLIQKTGLSHLNSKMSYILVVIDTFSKKAFARPLATKNGSEVAKAFRSIFKEAEATPENLRTDKGLEFMNKTVQALFTEHKIHYYTTQDPQKKAAIVERLNRTLQARLEKYMSQWKTWKWTNGLKQIMKSYNASYHRSIGMSPNEVNKDNEKQIFKRLFPDYERTTTQQSEPDVPLTEKFSVGDKVRIQRELQKFDKGYTQGFTDEIFTIARIVRGYDIDRYILKDSNGEDIVGSFYGEELSIVRQYV